MAQSISIAGDAFFSVGILLFCVANAVAGNKGWAITYASVFVANLVGAIFQYVIKAQ